MTLNIGTQLGPYQILLPLGRGGMGEVYRAKDTRLGREVAIKVLPMDLVKTPEALHRFEREAKALAMLSHPNIVTIHDVGTEKGISYVVMELLEGETLRARFAHSTFRWEEAFEIAVPVVEGLSAAHSKGVIHRDLKPENIFLLSDGRVKILDFGLARRKEVFASGELTDIPTSSQATESGSVMGTMPYMSPEQISGASVDGRSDIFSFGCVLYEMLSGHRPFSRNSAAETVAAILKEDPPPFVESRKEIPLELERITTHCLEKNPEQRFQTARDLAFALREVLSSPGVAKTLVRKTSAQIPSYKHGLVITVLAALLAGALIYLFLPSGKTIDSLAVLPFLNVTGDTNSEYLSDGITESLINSLSELPNLTVMSRNSVFRYKGRLIDAQTVGRDLKVKAVLMGRIVQRGDNLSISTELIDVRNNSHLWGEQYNQKLADILAVQDQISKEISEKLRLKLSGEQQRLLTRRYTENTEAYQIYLKGRFFFNKRTSEGMKKAIEYFNEAIEKDPDYALAYAGLADAYAWLGSYRGILAPGEAYPKAKAAATKALQLDDTQAEAHSALANIKLQYDWDWLASEREFKHAIFLNPNNAEAHHLYSHYFMAMGKIEESLVESKRALELDPLDLATNVHLGWHYLLARQYDQAIENLQKTIELGTNANINMFSFLAKAYQEKGLNEKAIALLKNKQFEDNPLILSQLGHAYAVSGKRSEAQKAIEDLKALSERLYVSPYQIAIIYAGLGDKDRAFEWLDKAFDDRSDSLIYLKVDPQLDSLRSDVRFSNLMRRIGLPP